MAQKPELVSVSTLARLRQEAQRVEAQLDEQRLKSIQRCWRFLEIRGVSKSMIARACGRAAGRDGVDPSLVMHVIAGRTKSSRVVETMEQMRKDLRDGRVEVRDGKLLSKAS